MQNTPRVWSSRSVGNPFIQTAVFLSIASSCNPLRYFHLYFFGERKLIPKAPLSTILSQFSIQCSSALEWDLES